MYSIITMTRLGQESFQKSRADVYKTVNSLLKDEKTVYRVQNKMSVNTQKFPEGHIQFPGSFILEGEYRNNEIELDYCEEIDFMKVSKVSLASNIAFLNSKNCALFCYEPFSQFFNHYGLQVDFITDQDVRDGILTNYSLVIVPGGPDAGESYYEGLGQKGYDELIQFIKKGGNYLGSCAGSYFPLQGKEETLERDVWLNIVEATDECTLDYWRTGTGFVRVQVEEVSHPIFHNLAFGKPSTLDMIYWEGPVFDILDNSKVKILATYKDFIASSIQPPSWSLENNSIAIEAMTWSNPLSKDRFDKYMREKPAIIESSYERGRLVLLSPHAEFGTCGTSHLMKDNPNYELLMNTIYYLSKGEE